MSGLLTDLNGFNYIDNLYHYISLSSPPPPILAATGILSCHIRYILAHGTIIFKIEKLPWKKVWLAFVRKIKKLIEKESNSLLANNCLLTGRPADNSH